MRQVKKVLGRRHNFPPDDPGAVWMWDTVETAEMVNRVYDMMQTFLGVVAVVTLVLGGVASLVLLLAYGNGFGTAMMTAFDQIGKDLIVVFPGQTSLQAGGERAGRRVQLELRDVEALKEGVPAIDAIRGE
ncbi:MAG: ABC transporter permease [Verrucomicrobia bacterium]|nr:ABC transporter permease [Verrucomicrobiota bacterium]